MVSEAERIASYEAKMREILEALGLGAYIEKIFAQFAEATKEAVEAETAVKSEIKQIGYLGAYQGFGKEIQSIKSKHSGAMAVAEANIKLQKWKARGLSEASLKNIAAKLGLTL